MRSGKCAPDNPQLDKLVSIRIVSISYASDELRSSKYAPDNPQHDLLATIDVAAIDYAPEELICGTKRMRFPYAFRQSDIRARFLFANIRAKFCLRGGTYVLDRVYDARRMTLR